MQTTSRITTIVLLLLGVTACASPAPETADNDMVEEVSEPTEAAEDGVIVLGDISDDPANVIEEMQPLADYLAANLGDYGITQGDIVVVGSPEEMAEKLASGEIDLYFDSVYPATVVSDASGAQPFLRRWRDGVEEYHTVIFTTSDSGVTSIEDLQGHMIAFDEPTSTSGFVLPYVYLVEHGLTLVEKESPEDEVAPDEVGYIFSEDDDNSLDWVNTGRVAAAATDNISYEEDIPADIRVNLVVLGETESLPRQVAVVRPDMDPALRAAIVDVLVHMHQSEEGQAALEEFDDTARFDEFPQGLDAAAARMRELLEIIEANTAP